MIYKMKTLLAIVESLTGNTMTFLDSVEDQYPHTEWDILYVTPQQMLDGIVDIDKTVYDRVIIGSYTWNMGEIPKRTKKFVIEYRDWLLGQNVLIFGSGWSVYESYAKAVDSISLILDHKFPTIKFELTYDEDREDCQEEQQILTHFMEGDYVSEFI